MVEALNISNSADAPCMIDLSFALLSPSLVNNHSYRIAPLGFMNGTALDIGGLGPDAYYIALQLGKIPSTSLRWHTSSGVTAHAVILEVADRPAYIPCTFGNAVCNPHCRKI